MVWTKEKIDGALEQVIHPTLGLSVVEMDLIYEVVISDRNDVHVLMTHTAPHEPDQESLTDQMQRVIGALPGVGKVVVDVTSKPPSWDASRLTDQTVLNLHDGY